MSESEPLMTHRKTLKETAKTEAEGLTREKSEGNLLTVQAADGVKAA